VIARSDSEADRHLACGNLFRLECRHPYVVALPSL